MPSVTGRNHNKKGQDAKLTAQRTPSALRRSTRAYSCAFWLVPLEEGGCHRDNRFASRPMGCPTAALYLKDWMSPSGELPSPSEPRFWIEGKPPAARRRTAPFRLPRASSRCGPSLMDQKVAEREETEWSQ
jgi:hypothetical protein